LNYANIPFRCRDSIPLSLFCGCFLRCCPFRCRDPIPLSLFCGCSLRRYFVASHMVQNPFHNLHKFQAAYLHGRIAGLRQHLEIAQFPVAVAGAGEKFIEKTALHVEGFHNKGTEFA
jgi:hypothetical protein